MLHYDQYKVNSNLCYIEMNNAEILDNTGSSFDNLISELETIESLYILYATKFQFATH